MTGIKTEHEVAQECRQWARLTMEMFTDIPPADRVLAADAFIAQMESKQGFIVWHSQYYYGIDDMINLNSLFRDIKAYVKGHTKFGAFTREDAVMLIKSEVWPVISYLEEGFDLEMYVTENILIGWGVFTITNIDGKFDTVMHTLRGDIFTAVADYVNECLGGDPSNLDTCEMPIVVQIVDTSDM